MADAPTTAYTEVQIDNDSISLTLLSEGSDGVTVEDTERFTFEELQEMAGEHLPLRFSPETRQSLSDQRRDANVGRILQADGLAEKAEELPQNPSTDELLAYMGFIDDRPESEVSSGNGLAASQSAYETPQVADVMRDTNPPSWSKDARVRVVEVTDTPADEYELDTDHWKKNETVADHNPSEPADAPVVVANYIGSQSEYAFPCTRLEQVN